MYIYIDIYVFLYGKSESVCRATLWAMARANIKMAKTSNRTLEDSTLIYNIIQCKPQYTMVYKYIYICILSESIDGLIALNETVVQFKAYPASNTSFALKSCT